MITEIKPLKAVVISDLHLGNPFSKAKEQVVPFLRWAGREGYDVIINGDGFEIAQTSFAKLARDVPEVLHALKTLTQEGHNVYYVVGNHDIVFENFLNDWGGFKVAPFLNVWSGDLRIRVEHGHLYDPFFVKAPNLYEFLTWAAGFLLKVHPNLYKAWIGFEKIKSRLLSMKMGMKKGAAGHGIAGEDPQFSESALELLARGFDAVIFGHTHHAGEVTWRDSKRYLNSGSWLMRGTYITIQAGQIDLKTWDPISTANAPAISKSRSSAR